MGSRFNLAEKEAKMIIFHLISFTNNIKMVQIKQENCYWATSKDLYLLSKPLKVFNLFFYLARCWKQCYKDQDKWCWTGLLHGIYYPNRCRWKGHEEESWRTGRTVADLRGEQCAYNYDKSHRHGVCTSICYRKSDGLKKWITEFNENWKETHYVKEDILRLYTTLALHTLHTYNILKVGYN